MEGNGNSDLLHMYGPSTLLVIAVIAAMYHFTADDWKSIKRELQLRADDDQWDDEMAVIRQESPQSVGIQAIKASLAIANGGTDDSEKSARARIAELGEVVTRWHVLQPSFFLTEPLQGLFARAEKRCNGGCTLFCRIMHAVSIIMRDSWAGYDEVQQLVGTPIAQILRERHVSGVESTARRREAGGPNAKRIP